MARLWAGGCLGALAAAAAVLLLGGEGNTLAAWAASNLGFARWLFLGLALVFCLNLLQLHGAAQVAPDPGAFARVARLDQLTDVQVHLFVGIGVVWTAIGMRDALVAALAGPDTGLAGSADQVLRSLVDGGILVALSTTIVGGLGGYAMKLVKALVVGGPLQGFYDQHSQQDLQALLLATRRIEQRLAGEPAT